MSVPLPSLDGILLDAGDLGLIWTPQGFRPKDGVDVYLGGKAPLCPAVLSVKDAALDRVEVIRDCTSPTREMLADLATWAAPMAWASAATHTDHLPPVSICCTVGLPPLDVPPPAPIPLPAGGLLILTAMAGFMFVRAKGMGR